MTADELVFTRRIYACLLDVVILFGVLGPIVIALSNYRVFLS